MWMVTEAGVNASNAAVAGDAEAMGSFTVADLEQTDYATQVTIEGRVGSTGSYTTGDSTANSGPNGARGARIAGQYGRFFLTGADASGAIAWSYELDNDCGGGSGGSATDPGCATNALAANAMMTDTLRVRASDGAGSATDTPGTGQSRYSATRMVTVTITGTNDAPVVVADALPAVQDITKGQSFSFRLPAAGDAFTDPDMGDTVRYTTAPTQADGSALPGWLSFAVAANGSGTFSGTAGTTPDMLTVRVVATDGAAGSMGAEATHDFTLHLRAAPDKSITPPTQTEDGTDIMDDNAEVDVNESAATAGVKLTATTFGYREMGDTRLASITIVTLPSAAEGRLVLLRRDDVGMVTGEVAVAESQTISRKDLESGNLVLVSNTKDDADVEFTFTTTATAGNEASAITTAMAQTLTVGGDDDAPVAVTRTVTVGGQRVEVTGIAPQEANEGDRFSYTIRLPGDVDGGQVVTRETADFDPVDTDDTDLIFTAHAVNAGSSLTALRLPADTGADTAANWLRFDPATGEFSGTPPEGAADVRVRVRAKDARDDDRYSATSTFTLTVTGGRPMFTIVGVTHDSARGRVVVAVGLAESSPPVTRDTTVTVNVTAEGYITDAAGKRASVTFTATSMGNKEARVALDRSFGPGAMIKAVIVASGDYEVSPAAAETGSGVQAPIAGNDQRVRGQYVEQALGGFARSMGWNVVDSVRSRAGAADGGGAMQRSAVDLTGLVDYARMKTDGASDPVDVDALLRLARAAGEGDSGRVGSELLDLATRYLQGKASPEGGPVAYHEAALAANEVPVPEGSGGGYLGDSGDSGDSGNSGDSHDAAIGIGEQYADLDSSFPQSEGGTSAGELPPGDSASAANPIWKDMRVWSSLKRDDLSFEDGDTDFSGDTLSLALGVEKPLGEDKVVGVALNWFTGDLDIDDNALAVAGGAELEQWSLTPYGALRTDYGRVWGALGLGGGSMDYEDGHRGLAASGSSDVTMNMLAAGAEYDIMQTQSWTLVGRVEGMSAGLSADDGGDLYDGQDVRVHGLRGEVEMAWPMARDGGHYNPYLTAGFRWDGGDGTGGRAFEYGGGVDIDMNHLTFTGSMRLQGLGGDGDYDRRSFSLELAYDLDRDQRGLSLSVQNTRGSAESRDYFAQHAPWAQSAYNGLSADERGRTNVETGYGFAVRGLLARGLRAGRGGLADSGEGVLTPFVRMNLDGDTASEWSLGLTLESSFGNIDLVHTTRPATGGSGDQHEIQLNLSFGF